MFSVIIPTYNRIAELVDVLDSLLKQTKLITEIIIVDDSDGSNIEQLSNDMNSVFAEKNVELKYIRNNRGKSLTIARNIGIAAAISDIVLFLDDDVILDENYLMEILRIYNEYPDAFGVQGFIQNAYTVNENRIIERLRILYHKLFYFSFNYKNKSEVLPSTNTLYPTHLSDVITCEWLSGANQSYRKKIFEEFAFDENLRRYSFKEDVDFSYRIHKKYPNSLYMTPYAKLIHKVSNTSRLPKKDLILMKQIYSLYFFYKNITSSYTNKLIFLWCQFGYLIRNICNFIFKPSYPSYLRLRYFIDACIVSIIHSKEIKKGNLEFFNNTLGDKK
jgi:GT2 family glycosyltransferase